MLQRALVLMMLTMAALAGGILADGRLSGWNDLAGEYRTGAAGRELQISLQRGGLGPPRWYHRVAPLAAAIGFGGLRLSYPFPYSLGHPPLEIPWRALRVDDVTTLSEGQSQVVLVVSGPKPARITLEGDLANVVREWLTPAR